jgi:hypothetical protein
MPRLPVDPLLNLAGDDIHDLFLTCMLVEAVRLPGREHRVEES